jgi:hypothetical protein
MNKKALLWVTFVLAALAESTMVDCGRSDDTKEATGSGGASAASLPVNLFLTAAPGDLVTIKRVKEQARVGDEVVVRVVVGGEMKVFVDGRAIVKVIDTEMKNLCLSPSKSCKTPLRLLLFDT